MNIYVASNCFDAYFEVLLNRDMNMELMSFMLTKLQNAVEIFCQILLDDYAAHKNDKQNLLSDVNCSLSSSHMFTCQFMTYCIFTNLNSPLYLDNRIAIKLQN